MRLTSFSDYCLRVLIYLAARPGERTTIADIAKSYGISENHLVKVVHFLGKEGILANERGRGGGVHLARAPSAINVGKVVRIAEGAAIPAACFDPAAAHCSIAPACRLKLALGDAVRAFYAVLDGYTLADLVDNHARLRSILVAPPRGKAAAHPARRAS